MGVHPCYCASVTRAKRGYSKNTVWRSPDENAIRQMIVSRPVFSRLCLTPAGMRIVEPGDGSLVIVLWAGFLANYPLTRDVYFTLAMLHVLAEVPLLLRAL